MKYYSDKENINILTALLVSHGIEDAVLCPGSRNAPINHNLSICPKIKVHFATDERSAAFQAMGIAQATGKPVVVSVTSGTALLNTAPAVAEATYQHQGIIVISADRPAAWIGQADGQTLPQPGALGNFVGKCVNIPEPHSDEDRWHINRLVNEALIETKKHHRPSVHINVPLNEPLFECNVKKLPKERVITLWESAMPDIGQVLNEFVAAKRPMIVVGQMSDQLSYDTVDDLAMLADRAIIIHEALNGYDELCTADLVLYALGENNKKYVPDFVLHIGGELVSRRLKTFLQKAKNVWRIAPNCEIADTYMNVTNVLSGDTRQTLFMIAASYRALGLKTPYSVQQFFNLWHTALEKADDYLVNYEPAYSQAAAVKAFERQFYDSDYAPHIHYANSTSIRLANLFARHSVWCNRGVNGIDGSVSTAAGFASALKHHDEFVVLVTGDLSFFYDCNGLWDNGQDKKLKILLLNNHDGGIFRQVRGFDTTSCTTGTHSATAEGICLQNHIAYIPVHNMEELNANIEELDFYSDPEKSVVIEVFTDELTDAEEFKKIYKNFTL